MDAHKLRNKLGTEEFDYQTLLGQLKNYKAPNQKINGWLKSGDIVRVKKGLYVFGAEIRRDSYSKKLLANWIYGPSYISLHSALSYYGLIPERVEILTSVTSKKDKMFKTPIGDFSYRYLNLKKYPLGIVREKISSGRHTFIASPEKALVDTLTLSTFEKTKSQEELKHILYDDLRIDEADLRSKLQVKNLRKISESYKSSSLTHLLKHLED